jgi:hypothetical protein
MSDLKAEILRNAETVRRLKARIDETFRARDESPANRAEWQKACAEFHDSYDRLAFPGGYDSALDRIAAGDAAALEAALCFVECRPYFFRSGYMFAKLMRKLKRAPLSPAQQARLEAVIRRLAEWKEKKPARSF